MKPRKTQAFKQQRHTARKQRHAAKRRQQHTIRPGRKSGSRGRGTSVVYERSRGSIFLRALGLAARA